MLCFKSWKKTTVVAAILIEMATYLKGTLMKPLFLILYLIFGTLI